MCLALCLAMCLALAVVRDGARAVLLSSAKSNASQQAVLPDRVIALDFAAQKRLLLQSQVLPCAMCFALPADCEAA
eukprot:103812-Rhodomonas_salina.1